MRSLYSQPRDTALQDSNASASHCICSHISALIYLPSYINCLTEWTEVRGSRSQRPRLNSRGVSGDAVPSGSPLPANGLSAGDNSGGLEFYFDEDLEPTRRAAPLKYER